MHAGMYEFGREDGAIEPRFVRIALTPKGVPFPVCAPEDVRKLARHALGTSGFWWRLILPPKVCPIDKDGVWCRQLPPAPRGGGRT